MAVQNNVHLFWDSFVEIMSSDNFGSTFCAFFMLETEENIKIEILFFGDIRCSLTLLVRLCMLEIGDDMKIAISYFTVSLWDN